MRSGRPLSDGVSTFWHRWQWVSSDIFKNFNYLFHWFILIFFRTVSFDEFREIVQETSLHKNIPFPLESSDFVKLYFGKDKSRVITYAEFSQFLHDFHDEYAQVCTFSNFSCMFLNPNLNYNWSNVCFKKIWTNHSSDTVL